MKILSLFLVFSLVMSYATGATDPQPTPEPEPAPVAASDFGPQAPRDIDNKAGENPSIFSFAPDYQTMNLCNIHFHVNAEHKAADYSKLADDDHGGYVCSDSLTADELKSTGGDVCKGLEPGDTIEVHWVYSSCDVEPGKGLGSCLSDSCGNPNLRVEAQVFVLVNDANALDFEAFRVAGEVNGYQQAKKLPGGTGTPVRYLGSTTGPSYTATKGSPLQVSWSVRPECAKLDINSLGDWCKDNVFQEDHAHGVRKLVTDKKQLSKIK